MIPEIQKILYATDLSPNSVYAMRYAMNSAIKHDAGIIILHVFEQVSPTSRAMVNLYLNEIQLKKIFEEHMAEAKNLIRNRLKSMCDQEFKDHPEYADKIISIETCEGFPADEILKAADELTCDVIIMGTHGKGFLANTFLGSTAKRVLRRTRKPVFIIPLPRKKKDTSPGD